MFYRPAEGHGLTRNPINAIVAPRPIGWISTTGSAGDNLAPYSYFNLVAYTPLQVMFASNGLKDSLRNIRETGVFCVNIVSEPLLAAMNATSADVAREVDEFDLAGLAKAPCVTIDCPRVAAAPAALECRRTMDIALAGQDNVLIVGEVTGVHVSDAALVDGRVDTTRLRPAARLGYADYTIVREVAAVKRPAPE